MNNIAIDIRNYFFNGGAVGPSANKFQSLLVVSDLVTWFTRTVFVIAGLILLFYFIMGGIGMMQSAGSNDPKAAEQAKQTITSAVIGFVVVFTSYWIVKLIGQILGIPAII